MAGTGGFLTASDTLAEYGGNDTLWGANLSFNRAGRTKVTAYQLGDDMPDPLPAGKTANDYFKPVTIEREWVIKKHRQEIRGFVNDTAIPVNDYLLFTASVWRGGNVYGSASYEIEEGSEFVSDPSLGNDMLYAVSEGVVRVCTYDNGDENWDTVRECRTITIYNPAPDKGVQEIRGFVNDTAIPVNGFLSFTASVWRGGNEYGSASYEIEEGSEFVSDSSVGNDMLYAVSEGVVRVCAYDNGDETWDTVRECRTITIYNPDDTLPAPDTVYYLVTFGSRGDTIRVQSGGTVAQPAAPTRDDCNFGGWYKDVACTHAWIFDSDVVTSDIVLYAKWIPIENDEIPNDTAVEAVSPTSVNIKWEAVEDAIEYIIVIYIDAARTQVILSIILAADGKVKSIAKSAGRAAARAAGDGSLECVIEDLLPGTSYYYTVTALDDNEAVLAAEFGNFVTIVKPLAVAAQSFASLQIYPNPIVNGQLTIDEGQSQAGEQVEIYNVNGVLVGSYSIRPTINIGHLPAGTYIVKVGGRVAKVVKQ
jgi:hypothetical protein